jgi:hypothetical protein
MLLAEKEIKIYLQDDEEGEEFEEEGFDWEEGEEDLEGDEEDLDEYGLEDEKDL